MVLLERANRRGTLSALAEALRCGQRRSHRGHAAHLMKACGLADRLAVGSPGAPSRRVHNKPDLAVGNKTGCSRQIGILVATDPVGMDLSNNLVDWLIELCQGTRQ